ncbi:MAG: ABC transporter permease [Saprospiraceae bacterium]|nr:ABC transporter permease [Lewinella sp.]
MDKLWLIIKREYLTRVKRRSFLLATFLTPLAMGLFMVVVTLIFSYQSDDSKRIAIIDKGNILVGNIASQGNIFFQKVDMDLETLKSDFSNEDFNGILYLPPVQDVMDQSYQIYFYTDEKLTLDVEPVIMNGVRRALREYKINQLQLDKRQLAALDTNIDLEPRPISPTAENNTGKLASKIAAVLGFAMGFVMYLTVFIYGMMVMRSVMEEKTSRIVEVMISSVKPFQLMMGKIIGVGAVGLTQLAIWLILFPLILLITSFFAGVDPAQMEAPTVAAQMDPEEAQTMILQVMDELYRLNWWVIIPMFIIYFLGGYFIYSSLFAAVGSAMGDDLGEGQSLTLPITIPVLLAFYIMIASVESPNSSLAVWSSVFPLFSPIVMAARIPYDPPAWQIILSLFLLIGTAIGLVWVSGRIYRVGILMYGKKVKFKELLRWMFVKM